MAEQAASVLPPTNLPFNRATHRFPFKAVLLALFVVLLPLLPSQAPPGFAEQAFLTKTWELLHLLFVGITVSYGLFSRKNADRGADKDLPAKPDTGYARQMLRDSLVFDDDDLPYSPPDVAKMQSWSSLHRPDESVVLVAEDGVRSHCADTPLSLPIRDFNMDTNVMLDLGRDIVLPSPIPWRSRSGRLNTSRPAPPSPSPKRLSPASSLCKETLAKTGEDSVKRRSPYKSSSQPPEPPPPPPPPFLGHGHNLVTARTMAVKSFKEELNDHNSMRGKIEYLQSQTSHSLNSTYGNSTAKPRSSFDGSFTLVGKSVRTFRPREVQSVSQELQDDASLHGSSEESYGYSAYQTIPKFQYEKATDHIMEKVTVSSDDDSESGDDDDVDGYSERASPTPEVDENEVDRKAEEFIKNFRESIRLQRIESIKKSAGPRGLKHSK